jgi:hypothetical protein
MDGIDGLFKARWLGWRGSPGIKHFLWKCHSSNSREMSINLSCIIYTEAAKSPSRPQHILHIFRRSTSAGIAPFLESRLNHCWSTPLNSMTEWSLPGAFSNPVVMLPCICSIRAQIRGLSPPGPKSSITPYGDAPYYTIYLLFKNERLGQQPQSTRSGPAKPDEGRSWAL